MPHRLLVFAVCCLMATPALAQSPMSQLLSGQLINPRNGVWAWYELNDTATGEKYFLRQAIVGEEREGKKAGYWLEVQVRPQVGFATTYKMLLTGPASDPANVRRIYYQAGNEPVQRIEPESLESQEPVETPQLDPLNQQTIDTPNGPIVANYYKLEDGTEFWLSDAVPPMGIVRFKSAEGELRLQRFGEGGPDAATALPTEEDKPQEKDGKKAPKGKEQQEVQPAPANALPDAAPLKESEPETKRNFQGKGKK